MKVPRKLFLALMSLMALAAVPPANPQNPSTLPQLFFSQTKDRQAPIWVSVSLVRTADQQLDLSPFSKEEREALDRKLATQERLKAEERPKSLSSTQKAGIEAVRDDNCVVYETSFLHLSGGPREPGFRGLTQTARSIHVASVVEVSQGFFLGSPASLLRLQVKETLKHDRRALPPTELVAVYPFARFAIGDHVFCSGMPGSATPPQVGQQVLAFVASESLDRQHSLVYLSPDQLVTEGVDGTLSLPRALREDRELYPVRTLKETTELVRRALLQPVTLRSPSPGESGK